MEQEATPAEQGMFSFCLPLRPLMVDASGVKLHTRHVGLLVLEASGGKQLSLYFLGTEEVTLAGRLSAKGTCNIKSRLG